MASSCVVTLAFAFPYNLVCLQFHWSYGLFMLQNSHVRYLRTNYIRSHHGHKGQISQTIDIQKVRQSDNETLRKMYASHLRIRLFIFIGKAIRKIL